MVPPRDSKPKRPAFSDSEQAEINERERLLDDLVFQKKFKEELEKRRKTWADFFKGTYHVVAAGAGLIYIGRDAIAWAWKTWLLPFLKATLGGP